MKGLLRLVVLVLIAALALELFFVLRIGTMAVIAPQSTSFQRSEAWRIATEKHPSTGLRTGLRWRQQWVAYRAISRLLEGAPGMMRMVPTIM